ncbi:MULTISPECIES: hypothetical protein [Metabacillus]|jgi:hypothetical protein|uniref:Uncharacterized protein n=1 Tax=Metabacillus rhizolycopersici TaxID=2875709 RepID=A0ABS7ULM3_9BACI|nr:MULTISPECIES: hypothetical protein [Metabacillus]MBZ5749221.1 hypothetical protein [Metabacillus rhizolycopersici]MCM3652008.1 hypothetical protein [Metabacillus litoralis]
MLNEGNLNRMIIKEEKEKSNILKYIDGSGFDQLLHYLIKGLFWGIILFCLPYFCFMLITFIF